MARHAIDAAIVWERAGQDEGPVWIRLAIDEPYVDAKSLLLQVIAQNSRCRTVWHTDYALWSVVGSVPTSPPPSPSSHHCSSSPRWRCRSRRPRRRQVAGAKPGVQIIVPARLCQPRR